MLQVSTSHALNFVIFLKASLLKAPTNRKMGNGNEAFDEKVINYHCFLQKFSPRAAEVVSVIFRGPGQRWVQRFNIIEVQDCIFDVTHDGLLSRMNKADEASAVGSGVPVTFSIAINATKLEKGFEVSDSHKSIIGGAFPNHVFDISDLPKDDVNNVIAGTSSSVKINKSTEVKVVVTSFQSTETVLPPSAIINAQPQGTNETSNFVHKLNAAAIEAGYNKSFYTDFCVDVVISESDDVCESI